MSRPTVGDAGTSMTTMAREDVRPFDGFFFFSFCCRVGMAAKLRTFFHPHYSRHQFIFSDLST